MTLDLDMLYRDARDVSQHARGHARDVDQQARFPTEAFATLRERGFLGLAMRLASEYGDASISILGRITQILARGCSSTGLIYAMHQAQVMTLLRFAGRSHATWIDRIADEQLLLASVTSEISTGGDVTKSSCFVSHENASVSLKKATPAISYGGNADAFLVTARRSETAAAHDQVLVFCPRASVRLTQTSEWDSLGMRGTVSNGYNLAFEGAPDLVLAEPFAEISSRALAPFSHLYWSFAWVGIAEACLSEAIVAARDQNADKERHYYDMCLAELRLRVNMMRQLAENFADSLASASIDLAAVITSHSNSLKVTCSKMLSSIAIASYGLVGFSAYADQHSSMARLLRDALSAPVMINNHRIMLHQARTARARPELL